MPHMLAGEWHHVVLVANQTGVRASLDGARVSSASPFTLQSNFVELGTRGTNWFDGRIDEVRIYARALKNSEIMDLVAFLTSRGDKNHAVFKGGHSH